MEFPELPTAASAPENGDIAFESEDRDIPFTDALPLEIWIRSCAREEGKPLGNLTFIFCSDEHLYEMNVRYLNHHTLTDVITFQLAPGRVEGDIFISTDRVVENAGKAGVPWLHELYRVMIHGVLHMTGYSDKTAKAQKVMREKEDFWLSQLPKALFIQS